MKVCIDTRIIQPGDTFIPVKGKQYDGHDFIEEAIKKGAHVLDVDLTDYARRYRKKLKCQVIGVTGSAGKTTVKDMLYTVLSHKYNVVKTEQNQNNEIGVPLTILKAEADTDILIVEMAMRHKGEIAHLAKIACPTHAVVTSVGLTHVENLKTPLNIARAKAEIFQKPYQWQQQTRYAYINFSSSYYELLQKKAVNAGFSVFPFKGETSFDQNLNLAYLVGRHFKLTDDDITAALKNYRASSHRLDVKRFERFTVIDDSYNANPDGVKYALKYMQRFSGRRIFVFGDMLELGTFSKKEHEKVVDYALDAGVSIMFTHGKETACITSPHLPVYHFNDKKTLCEQLTAEIKKGDVILVKGSRGMKMEEIVDVLSTL